MNVDTLPESGMDASSPKAHTTVGPFQYDEDRYVIAQKNANVHTYDGRLHKPSSKGSVQTFPTVNGNEIMQSSNFLNNYIRLELCCGRTYMKVKSSGKYVE